VRDGKLGGRDRRNTPAAGNETWESGSEGHFEAVRQIHRGRPGPGLGNAVFPQQSAESNRISFDVWRDAILPEQTSGRTAISTPA